MSADFCTSAALALALCLVLPALLYICVLYVHLYVLYRPCYLGPLLRPLGGPPCVLGRCTFVSVANVTHFLLIVDLQRPSLVLFHFGIIVMPLAGGLILSPTLSELLIMFVPFVCASSPVPCVFLTLYHLLPTSFLPLLEYYTVIAHDSEPITPISSTARHHSLPTLQKRHHRYPRDQAQLLSQFSDKI